MKRGQAGGAALVERYGNEHMREIGRKGVRPRSKNIHEVFASRQPIKIQEKELSQPVLLAAWRRRQLILRLGLIKSKNND